jgi:hypothetical protein
VVRSSSFGSSSAIVCHRSQRSEEVTRAHRYEAKCSLPGGKCSCKRLLYRASGHQLAQHRSECEAPVNWRSTGQNVKHRSAGAAPVRM